MGNYKFRLSDMIPNVWFHKLKDMKNPTKISPKTHISQPKFSYNFPQPTNSDKIFPLSKHPRPSISHFPDPPRKSSKNISTRKPLHCTCDSVANSVQSESESTQSHRVSSAGMKLRANSPKVHCYGEKKSKLIEKSVAIVMFSFDPEKDFRDSMVEMIVENNICGLKELEELLGRYLSLNSKEFHHHIVMAFEQIWVYLNHLYL